MDKVEQDHLPAILPWGEVMKGCSESYMDMVLQGGCVCVKGCCESYVDKIVQDEWEGCLHHTHNTTHAMQGKYTICTRLQ